MHQKYNTDIENVFLPQHVSLKQSFPYNGNIETIENYFKESFLISVLFNICPF